MNILSLVLLVLFSVVSSAVMTYISLATMIGPWMGPTLVLVALAVSSLFRSLTPQRLLLPVLGGALGGIIATAIGFSLPTLYFINQTEFMTYLDNPYACMGIIFVLILVAGCLAFLLVEYCKKDFLEDRKLPFPVGKLVYEVAMSPDSSGSKKRLIQGIGAMLLYAVVNSVAKYMLRAKAVVYDGCLAATRSYQVGICKIPALRFDMGLLPMFVAIGFLAGHQMTVPLLLGAALRILFVDTLHDVHFAHVSDSDFMFAFCSGIVAVGFVIYSLKMIIPAIKGFYRFSKMLDQIYRQPKYRRVASGCILVALILSWWSDFSWGATTYVIIGTLLASYQLVVIAGEIGMSLLGRFATFVMMPGLFIFNFSALQATMVATFVELCGGIATELCFGWKTAELANLNKRDVRLYQIGGIIIAAATVAAVFWLLVTHFQLGSDQLFAQRAQSRALLIQAGTFDIKVVMLGALCGLILHLLQWNSMLILGGLLMSLSMIIPLVIGGVLSWAIPKKDRFAPFCSGVYATNSIVMILSALL